MTRTQWDALWKERFKALRHAYPTKDLDVLREKARRQCEKNYGPRPGTFKGALLRVAWEFVRKGGNVNFSWSKNLWKAARGGLGVVAAAAVYAGLEVLLTMFDTPEELKGMNIPQVWIPLILAVGVSLRNWLKVKKGIGAAKG